MLEQFCFRRFGVSRKYFFVIAFCSRKFAETSKHLRSIQPSFFPRSSKGERERWRQAAGGWVGSFISAQWETPTLSSLSGLRGAGTWQEEPETKEQRTIGMYAAHNPLSWRVLSVAGRWLGCVLEQSTALRLRWCEAVVVMGMPRDVLHQMIYRSLPAILFPAHLVWCYFLRSSAANGNKHLQWAEGCSLTRLSLFVLFAIFFAVTVPLRTSFALTTAI